MNTGVPIEPERRVVTILYADIVGSTKIISGLDPDDAADFLDPAINNIIRSIHNFGGTVARVQGDGVKAVFGATHTQEDHALRAAMAGLEMVNQLQAGPQRPGIPRADLRVGMHSGYVIVRWQKNDLGGGLDTVGSTGHVAAKIEQIARPNHVTLSETSADLIKGSAQFAPVLNSNIEQGGKSIKLFEINSLDANQGSLDNVNTKLLPLVGRESELNRLNSIFNNNFADGEKHVYVVGDAGIGKSRLVREVSLFAARGNVRVEIASGISVFKDTPYFVLRNVAIKLLRLPSEPESDAIDEIINGLDLAEREQLGLTKLVMSKLDAIATWDLPADDKLTAIQTAMVKLITSIVNHAPLLLIVEDFHDVDFESARCLEFIVRKCQKMALGLIVTTRPIGEASAKKLTDSKLELTALRIDQAKDMIENEINQRKHSRISGDINDMVEDIISRAEGLPLALMEFAKLVSINPGMSIKTGQMPLALEPLIHSKFDKLSPSALSLAQYASALGNKVSETQLMQTVNLPDEDVKKGLAEIFEAKLLRKSNSGSLSFEHHLYQEICYNSMVRNRKREIHRKIYNEISVRAEKTGAHSVAYGSQILAYHAQKAGLLPEALDHLWQACTQAIATSAIRTAQSLYHRAVAICDQIGEDRQLRKLKFASLVFDALHQLAAHEEVLDVFEAARDRSFIGLKRTEEIVVRANIATILWISGKPDRAFPEAELALKLAEELDFIPVSAFANYAMANIEFVHGEIRKSVNRLTRISDIFVGDMAALRFGETITLPGVTCRTFASWYAVDLGELELAEKLENEAREIAVNQDHGYSKTLCDLAKGYKLYRTDKFKEASKFLTRAYSSCINESFFGLAPIAASWASSSLMGFGDDKQASEILEQELALDHIKSVRNCGLYYLHSAHAALLARRGQYDDAIDAHDKAFQATISNNDPVHQAYAHAGRAHLLATFGDAPEKAKEEYLLALELARNCEMARLVTACKTEIKSL